MDVRQKVSLASSRAPNMLTTVIIINLLHSKDGDGMQITDAAHSRKKVAWWTKKMKKKNRRLTQIESILADLFSYRHTLASLDTLA